MSEATCASGNAPAQAQALAGVEEAAVLVAADRLADAEARLLALIRTARPAECESAWLMLLEVLRMTMRRAAYEALRDQFRRRFGRPGPDWERPAPLATRATVTLPCVVGGRPSDLLDALRMAQESTVLVLDMALVDRIDYGFLHAFQGFLGSLAAAHKRVILANVGECTAVLLHAIGADRHAVMLRWRSGAPEAANAAVAEAVVGLAA